MVRAVLNSFEILINTSMDCPLCNLHCETIDHLFLRCSWATKLWSLCMRWWGVNYFPRNFQEWFQGWIGLCPNEKFRRVWVTHFNAIAWSIWEARNQVLFKGISAELPYFMDLVKFRVAWWFKHNEKGSSEPITVILENLKTCCIDVKACALCVSKPSLVGKRIIISSDSSMAVSWVNDKDFGNFCLWDKIAEIRDMLWILGNTSVSHCLRSSNEVADSLAKNGSLMEGESVE
ncbi:hypothetical protein Dsin_013373 [Dipteronia sinensis]|uniref:Reverse transcriptase zinc-binding domain-containing protein n=1 Tax=Dipteronia sinensis TaxID=43782 RepID=A0AAE0AJV2_9ROSI|nr:hypothetical protein Dsin_013373 [Dipteronia sinensis]